MSKDLDTIPEVGVGLEKMDKKTPLPIKNVPRKPKQKKDPYTIVEASAKDTVKVAKFLESIESVSNIPERKTLKEFLRIGFGSIMYESATRKYVGFILGYKTKERNVIAYFYIAPEMRRKPGVARLFTHVVKNFDKTLPTVIYSEDISTFEKRVKPISGQKNFYEWTEKKWVE